MGTVDPFLVAVATLSMLTEAAEEQPVVCVVDDAHWLDSASTDALLFATRRLEADRVAMVFAARDTDNRTFAPDGVPSLRLEGLDAASVRALLAEQRRGRGRRRGHRPAARRDRREPARARRASDGTQ